MTPTEFAAAADQTRLREKRREAARLVLVGGHSMAAAGRAVAISRQAVHEAVARIERVHQGLAGAPRDWCVVTVCVPAGDVDAVRNIERAALIDAGLRQT